MNPQSLKRYGTVALLYASLVAAAYAQVFFFNRSLLPSLYYPPGTTGASACSTRKPAPSFNIDLACPAFEVQPINRVVGDMYRSGTPPLWNPYQGCGVPLAAQYSTRAFFPFQIIEDICPWWSWDYFMLFRLVVAGFFTYSFLSLAGLPFTAAFTGGIVYMFSGSMTWFVNHEQFVNVAMMLPVAMAGLENLFLRPGKRSIVLLSAAVSLVLLAGQPEIAFYCLLLLAAYTAYRVLSDEIPGKEKARLAWAFSSSLALGAALSGVLLAPFLEHAFHSYHTHPFGFLSGAIDHAHVNFLTGIAFPPLTELSNFFDFFPHNGVWDNLGGYSGVTAIFLIVAGFFSAKRANARHFLFFSSAGILVLLKNFNFLPVSWIGYLPLFNQAWSPRWAGPVWTFSFACAAAMSFSSVEERPWQKKPLAMGAGVLVAGIALFFYAVLRFHSGLVSSFFSVVSDRLSGIAVPVYHLKDTASFFAPYLAAVLCLIGALVYVLGFHRDRKEALWAIMVLALAEFWLCIPRGMDPAWMPWRVAPFFIAFSSVILFLKHRKAPAYAGIALALCASVFIDLRSPHGLPQRCDPFRRGPFLDFLERQEGAFRIAGGKNLLMPNYAGVYRLCDIRFIVSMSPETYYAYTNEYLLQAPHAAPTDRLWFTGVSDVYKADPPSIYDDMMNAPAYYSFLGVRYVLAASEVSLPLPLVYDRDIRIYENPDCWPRVFVTDRTVRADTYQQAQAFINGSRFSPGGAIAVEGEVPQRYRDGEGLMEAHFSIAEYKPDTVVIQGESDRPGILVLTDIFYPGWRASVDGLPVPIFRVNGLVRGIPIDAGSHRVVFRYVPVSVMLGAGLTLCACAVCCGLWFRDRNTATMRESR